MCIWCIRKSNLSRSFFQNIYHAGNVVDISLQGWAHGLYFVTTLGIEQKFQHLRLWLDENNNQNNLQTMQNFIKHQWSRVKLNLPWQHRSVIMIPHCSDNYNSFARSYSDKVPVTPIPLLPGPDTTCCCEQPTPKYHSSYQSAIYCISSNSCCWWIIRWSIFSCSSLISSSDLRLIM